MPTSQARLECDHTLRRPPRKERLMDVARGHDAQSVMHDRRIERGGKFTSKTCIPGVNSDSQWMNLLKNERLVCTCVPDIGILANSQALKFLSL